MSLSYLDIAIIGAFLSISLVIGISYAKKASGGLEHFYLGGRSFPWWLAGLSMVATTFAADTPLAITELVAKNGISGNWLWWNMMAGGMLTTFFFAKLWWRSGILTDVELVELRYGGKPASFLRGMKAIYLGVFMNTLIIGWVNKALEAILVAFFGLTPDQAFLALAGMMIFTMFWTSLSGLYGVAITDTIQFGIAMTGCVILAYIVLDVPAVGGVAGLRRQLPPETFDFFPNVGGGAGTGTTMALGVGSFFAYIGVQWWSSWYPGAEPGGGGYVAQRIMSSKSQRDATFSALLFQVMHFCVRPWPWILVALSSLILYPGLAEPKMGYVYAMRDYLPTGFKGLLLATFLAAYMSTISSQLNWGSSYLINDLYLRFINPTSDVKKQIRFSRVGTVVLALFGLIVIRFMDSISGVWSFMLEAGAGIGLVLILRWYWWRINAWSEIVATIAPLVVYGLIKLFGSQMGTLGVFPGSFFLIVTCTTISWLVATFITKPEPNAVLERFYKQVVPETGWRPVRLRLGMAETHAGFGYRLVCWLSAVVLGYSILFLSGYLLFGFYDKAITWSVVLAVSLGVFVFAVRRAKIW